VQSIDPLRVMEYLFIAFVLDRYVLNVMKSLQKLKIDDSAIHRISSTCSSEALLKKLKHKVFEIS
jgi:hypothetical protein